MSAAPAFASRILVANRTIGKNIRRCREALAMTQETLAKRIGIKPGQIDKIETGVQWSSAGHLYEIAAALGVLTDQGEVDLNYFTRGARSIGVSATRAAAGEKPAKRRRDSAIDFAVQAGVLATRIPPGKREEVLQMLRLQGEKSARPESALRQPKKLSKPSRQP